MKYIAIAFVLIVLGVQGCSQSSPLLDAEKPYLSADQAEVGDILHTATGHYVSRQQMFSSLAHYPLVYVGEVHDNPASHRLQLDILKALQSSHTGQMALGMEMFNSEQQAALDRWVAGELDVKSFLRESRWFENWGSDFEHYRGLLEFCRDHKIPVIGLNTTNAIGQKVSMTPLDQLDEQMTKALPEMDMGDPYQQQMINAIFGAHGAGATMIQSFSRRQTLWDETMADSVASYMKANPTRRMVVIAGEWHVNYGFGIPRRVHRRLPLPYVLVGGENLVIPDENRDKLMNVELPSFPMRANDYLVYQEYEVFHPRGVILGVEMEVDSDGVLIIKSQPGSAAEIAGIQAGDILTQIDGEALIDNMDLIYALKTRRPGDKATVQLVRDGQSMQVEVEFAEAGKKHP